MYVYNFHIFECRGWEGGGEGMKPSMSRVVQMKETKKMVLKNNIKAVLEKTIEDLNVGTIYILSGPKEAKHYSLTKF